MRSILSRFRRPYIAGLPEQLMLMNSTGDGSTLTLDFTTGVLDPRLTFTRASGGTYVANDGYIYGMDFATSSSLAIGTGSKSVTLTATAGVDRRYLVGQTVYISNGANNMSGPVTAYNASTQALTINATATSGSGSFTSWTVGNASARFDHDPTTLAPRGLLIEGTATNRALRSNDFNTTVTDGTQWIVSGYTRGDVSTTLPDGTTGNACRISGTGSASFRTPSIAVNASTAYTFSFWARNNGGSQARYRVWNATAGSSIVDYTLPGSNYVSQIGGANNTSTTWVRVSVPFTTPVGCTSIFVYPTSSDTGTVDLLLWGAQVEEGSGASSYIPTGASTVQRLADNCYIYDTTTTGGLSWFKTATQGTFYVEMFKRTAGTAFAAAGFGTRATAFQEFMLYQAVGNNWLSFNWGAGEYTTNYSALSSPFLIKAAVALSPSTPATEADSTVSINGSNSALNTGPNIGLPFTSDLFCIGSRGPAGGTASSQNYAETAIRRIKFFPFAMTAAQMNAMTTL